MASNFFANNVDLDDMLEIRPSLYNNQATQAFNMFINGVDVGAYYAVLPTSFNRPDPGFATYFCSGNTDLSNLLRAKNWYPRYLDSVWSMSCFQSSANLFPSGTFPAGPNGEYFQLCYHIVGGGGGGGGGSGAGLSAPPGRLGAGGSEVQLGSTTYNSICVHGGAAGHGGEVSTGGAGGGGGSLSYYSEGESQVYYNVAGSPTGGGKGGDKGNKGAGGLSASSYIYNDFDYASIVFSSGTGGSGGDASGAGGGGGGGGGGTTPHISVPYGGGGGHGGSSSHPAGYPGIDGGGAGGGGGGGGGAYSVIGSASGGGGGGGGMSVCGIMKVIRGNVLAYCIGNLSTPVSGAGGAGGDGSGDCNGGNGGQGGYARVTVSY